MSSPRLTAAIVALFGVVVLMMVAGCGNGRPSALSPGEPLQPLAEDEPLRLRIRGTDERGRRVSEVFINGKWVSLLNDPIFDQWLVYQVARYEAFYQQTGTPKMQIAERGGCRAVFRTPVILEVAGDGHAGSAIHTATRRLREAGFAMPPQVVSSTGAVLVNPNLTFAGQSAQ